MKTPPRQAPRPPREGSPSDAATRTEELASRLHSAAIHLLRRLRRVDSATGLTASRLSALSVVVYAGPIRVGDLATAEQVSAPTTSRLVRDLVEQGLVRRAADPDDGRVQLVEATARGRRLLEQGRRRREELLASRLDALEPEERALLDRATQLLERIALPEDHPRRDRRT